MLFRIGKLGCLTSENVVTFDAFLGEENKHIKVCMDAWTLRSHFSNIVCYQRKELTF
jgi:hypothetical protein